MYSCNKCGKLTNKLSNEVYDGPYISEANTECTCCGYKDYWSYGFYESAQDMIGKCERY